MILLLIENLFNDKFINENKKYEFLDTLEKSKFESVGKHANPTELKKIHKDKSSSDQTLLETIKSDTPLMSVRAKGTHERKYTKILNKINKLVESINKNDSKFFLN